MRKTASQLANSIICKCAEDVGAGERVLRVGGGITGGAVGGAAAGAGAGVLAAHLKALYDIRKGREVAERIGFNTDKARRIDFRRAAKKLPRKEGQQLLALLRKRVFGPAGAVPQNRFKRRIGGLGGGLMGLGLGAVGGGLLGALSE